MNCTLSQRLERLELALNPAKPVVRVVVIPHGLSAAEREQFIRAEVERIGAPVLIVPAKAPPD